jgi:hypothetical protein
MAADPMTVTKIYEQVPLESMQQVNDSYMAWYVDRVTRQLDDTMTNLRAELRENDQKEASFRPSPLELEAIERLQRSGVTSVDLLDRMVEQGDDWLKVTMSRLDHFEQTGLAPKDYSGWCEHALGGAYDWIENDRLPASGSSPQMPAPRGPAPAPARQAAPQPAPGATVPGWLANRNTAPRGTNGEGPTAPVPTMPPTTTGYGAPRPQQPAPPAPAGGDDQDDGRRNIFKIFTN